MVLMFVVDVALVDDRSWNWTAAGTVDADVMLASHRDYEMSLWPGGI